MVLFSTTHLQFNSSSKISEVSRQARLICQPVGTEKLNLAASQPRRYFGESCEDSRITNEVEKGASRKS